MPGFLRGGDCVKTFCDDKGRTDDRFELTVVLSKPALLYVLMDRRLSVPEWLSTSFKHSIYRIGMDTGKRFPGDTGDGSDRFAVGNGPGDSIDLEFDVWKKEIRKPGAVKLGSNGKVWRGTTSTHANMYGIVATELPPNAKTLKKTPSERGAKNTTASLKEHKIISKEFNR